MPVVAQVGGVNIEIRYGSGPPPHFWANDGTLYAKVMITNLAVLKSTLPQNVINQVIQWAGTTGHQAALSREWVKAATNSTLGSVP